LHHVALLAVVALVGVSVYDQVFPTRHIHFDEVELSGVDGVGKNIVPRNTLNWLFSQLPVVQLLLNLLWDEVKAVVFPQVAVFKHHPVSVTQLDRLEEIGQVFVHGNHIVRDGEAPLLEQRIKPLAQNSNHEERNSNEEHGRGLAEDPNCV